MKTPYKLAVPLPGFNSRETFARVYQETCARCHSSLIISPKYNSTSSMGK